MPAQREVDLVSPLESAQMLLGQAGYDVAMQRVRPYVGQDRATPQRQCRGEARRLGREVATPTGPACLGDHLAEARQVEPRRGDLDAVPGGRGADRPGA